MRRLADILDDRINLELSKKSVSLTQDQQDEILKIRRCWEDISLCLSSFISGREDPFRSGEIKVSQKESEDLILHWADSYMKLMVLIFNGFPAIEMEVKRRKIEFPFSSSSELFLYVLLEEVSESVGDIFHSYKEISQSKAKKRLEYVANQLPNISPGSLIPKQLYETQYIFNNKNYVGWNWDEFIVRCLAASALQQTRCPKRELVAKCLQDCKYAQKSLIEDFYLPGYRVRKGNKWEKAFSGSYAWNKGRKVYWNRHTRGYN
jgi:hypothetical protein